MSDSTKAGLRDEDVLRLANAMWDLLTDMDRDGLCVCPAAKAQARIAYEPFAALVDPAGLAPLPMTLADAPSHARASGIPVQGGEDVG